ncbi:MAG: Holliday junction branch migration protein RuvA [Microbacteriaceae bacterium]|nr:Holliday junction branch migration protein RuvA [Microbacteriaceae bacterium]
MISSLRGIVLAASGARAVVEVGGVGYAVAVTPQHALGLREGEEARLHTALIVREDEMSLYGFATTDELEVFELLRGVTGVGPKSALGVLAAMAPAQIAAAVAGEDDAAFRKVSGIGPKTAKLIVVSLAGKLLAYQASASAAPAAPADGARDEARAQAVAALVGLGFQERHAIDAVDAVLDDAVADPAVQTLVRRALAVLSPAGVR